MTTEGTPDEANPDLRDGDASATAEQDDPAALRGIQGMNDWLPPDSRRLAAVEQHARQTLQRHGYAEVRPPILEHTALFARSIGGTTDIVEKEMYTFADRDRHSLTLRPEGTAGAVRAYIEHTVAKREAVTRWYYLGAMFRHERAQRGRYRQFYQLGAEALGVAEPGIDAEMIGVLLQLLGELGVPDLAVLLNSLGCPGCRPGYRDALVAFFAPHAAQLCADCQRRLQHNPLRVLDCKQERCQQLAAGAPQMLGLLCDPCGEHWRGLLADLDALDVPYQLDHRLVRGLDYYTRTTFELRSEAGQLGAQKTIAGGGRYDGLVEQLGGPPTPAVGFGLGLERLLLALPADRPPLPPAVDVCFVVRGDAARRSALPLARALRERGIVAEIEHRGVSVKSQMKRVGRLGAPLAVVLGESELAQGVVTLRRMERSEQDEVPRDELVARVCAALGRG